MALLGNPLVSSSFAVDYFSGNASTKIFTMSQVPAGSNSIIINISGTTLPPTDYSVSGTTLTFVTAPASGTNNVVVRHLGVRGQANSVSAGSVGNTELGNNAVGTINIQDGVVTPSKLSTGAPSWDATNTSINAILTTGGGVSTGMTGIEIGALRSNAGPAYIDFHAQSTGDYEARLIRTAGLNGNLTISNIGIGAFDIQTNGISRFSIDSNGQISANIFSTVGTSYNGLYKGYLARAWVLFNGATSSIIASGNVSSVTRSSTGINVINFTVSMPDSNYAYASGSNQGTGSVIANTIANSSLTITQRDLSGNLADGTVISVVVFR